jgi:hypothetical protein
MSAFMLTCPYYLGTTRRLSDGAAVKLPSTLTPLPAIDSSAQTGLRKRRNWNCSKPWPRGHDTIDLQRATGKSQKLKDRRAGHL